MGALVLQATAQSPLRASRYPQYQETQLEILNHLALATVAGHLISPSFGFLVGKKEDLYILQSSGN